MMKRRGFFTAVFAPALINTSIVDSSQAVGKEVIKTTPCIYCNEPLTDTEILTCKCVHCGGVFEISNGEMKKLFAANTFTACSMAYFSMPLPASFFRESL